MNNLFQLAYGPHDADRQFSTSSTYSCTDFGAAIPPDFSYKLSAEYERTQGAHDEREAVKTLTEDELRERTLMQQWLNAYGRKGGYGATLLTSAAYLKVLYTEWRRRELAREQS